MNSGWSYEKGTAMRFDFSGKTVIVTGGARGIGAAISTLFARTGANVMIDYIPVKRDIEGLKKIEDFLHEIKASYATYSGDITSPENMEKLCKETVDKFGRLDILVNSAGFTTPANIENLSCDMWRKGIEINLSGAYYITRRRVASSALALPDQSPVVVARLSILHPKPGSTGWCARCQRSLPRVALR